MITKKDHRFYKADSFHQDTPEEELKGLEEVSNLCNEYTQAIAQKTDELLCTCICLISIEKQAHVRKLPRYVHSRKDLYRIQYFAAQRAICHLEKLKSEVDEYSLRSFMYMITEAESVMPKLYKLAYPELP